VLAELSLPPWFDSCLVARRVIGEFGLPHVGTTGRGVTCATSDVEFDPDDFVDLTRAAPIRSRALGFALYPLAEAHLAHGYLALDEWGRTYLFSLVGGDLSQLAPTFDRGLERLLLGMAPDAAEVRAAWGTVWPKDLVA
jgi:hypothetical protein